LTAKLSTFSEKFQNMNHFLDIHLTAPDHLRAIIDQAAAMKSARAGRPRGAPDQDLPLKDHMVARIYEKP